VSERERGKRTRARFIGEELLINSREVVGEGKGESAFVRAKSTRTS